MDLILAPHADDEVMGCGGILAKRPGEFVVITVAWSGPERQQEHEAAMKTLGVDEFRSLLHADGRVGDDMVRLVTDLDEVLSVYEPEAVYLPYPSMHQDHVAVYEAGMRACRFSMHAHWSPPSVYVYDDVSYDLTLYPTDLRWNRFEVLTEGQIDLKVEAMRCYQSQQPSNGDHPAHGMKEIARALGASRGVRWAEQFAVVKEVVG